jgi:DNA invertase Pin-like site-specific DNA recombinase
MLLMELHEIRTLLNNGASIYSLQLRVAYYARVSTERDAQINSLTNQIGYYEDYIRNNENWTFCGGYIDEGISAISVKNRINFLRMIDDAKDKKFDLIITKEISRFSRNTLDSINYTRELLKNGVGVLFQSDNINTLMPDSELRLTIMASLAQEEVRKLSDRVKFGHKRAIKSGRVLGQKIIGYDKQDCKLTINEEEAKAIRAMFTIYSEGKIGIRKLSQEIERLGYLNYRGKPYHMDTIAYILQNPKYKGYYCGGKYLTPDYQTKKQIRLNEDEWEYYKDEESVPAIVNEELWDSVNAIYNQRRDSYKKHSPAFMSHYTYSGKIVCGEHGYSYLRRAYKKKNGIREMWSCRLYQQKGKAGCDNFKLESTDLDYIMSKLNSYIVENKTKIIEKLMEQYKNNIVSDKDIEKSIVKQTGKLNTINKKKEKLLELVIEGLIDKKEFAERNNTLNSEISIINNEITSLRDQLQSNSKLQTYYNNLEKGLNKTINNNLNFTDILLNKIIVHKVPNNNIVRLEIIMNTNNVYHAAITKEHHIIMLAMNKNISSGKRDYQIDLLIAC